MRKSAALGLFLLAACLFPGAANAVQCGPVFWQNFNALTVIANFNVLLTCVTGIGFVSPLLTIDVNQSPFNAVGDGLADDTAALSKAAAYMNTLGGGTLVTEPNKTYLVYNSGQPIQYPADVDSGVPMMNFSGENGLHLAGHWTFVVGHTFPAPQTVSGAVSDGGLCKLTVGSTANMLTNDTVWVGLILGAPGCNGVFKVTVIDATHLDLQASTFGGAYASGGNLTDEQLIVMIGLTGVKNLTIDGVAVTQTTPIVLPATSGIYEGTIAIFQYPPTNGAQSGSGGGNYVIENIYSAGGAAAFICSGIATDILASDTDKIIIVNLTANNQYYGVNMANNCDDVTIDNEVTYGVYRSYFVYGVSNHRVSITSRNALANDVILEGGGVVGTIRPTSNIRGNYNVLARDNGTHGASYFTIQDNITGAVFKDIVFSINADLAGEVAGFGPMVLIFKNGAAATGTSLDNIDLRLSAYSVPNQAGSLIYLWSTASYGDSWSAGEVTGVSLTGKLFGSATPALTMGGAALGTGGVTFRDFLFPGARTIDAASQALDTIFDFNASFNGLPPVAGCVTVSGGLGGGQSLQSINTTEYYGPGGYSSGGPTSSGYLTRFAGSLSHLNVVADSAPGGAVSDVATLFANGATTLTCSITGAATSCTDDTHLVTGVASQSSSFLKYVEGNGGSARSVTWSAQLCSP